MYQHKVVSGIYLNNLSIDVLSIRQKSADDFLTEYKHLQQSGSGLYPVGWLFVRPISLYPYRNHLVTELTRILYELCLLLLDYIALDFVTPFEHNV